MREIFTIVLVIIGALIGAGFASGQEIYSFFCRNDFDSYADRTDSKDIWNE